MLQKYNHETTFVGLSVYSSVVEPLLTISKFLLSMLRIAKRKKKERVGCGERKHFQFCSKPNANHWQTILCFLNINDDIWGYAAIAQIDGLVWNSQ